MQNAQPPATHPPQLSTAPTFPPTLELQNSPTSELPPPLLPSSRRSTPWSPSPASPTATTCNHQPATQAAFTEQDTPAPEDAYGISKWKAECALEEIANQSSMEVIIIRPPLMYGPSVKGNMLRLLQLAAKGIPLPLGAIHNQRSLLYVENLADFIVKCIDHPAAANETFLLSDNHDLSTTELLKMIREAMGKAPRLIPVPACFFRLAGKLTGKSAVIDRLLGSLQINSSKARTQLDWSPPFSVEHGIKEMVQTFVMQQS